MNHLDEGQVQAFLDDQPTGSERAAIAEHLMACAECRQLHDELRRARDLFARSVPVLDSVAPTGGRRRPAPTRRRASIPTAMVRAAGLVLFLAAAAAAAVPGSPVREWIVQAVDRVDEDDVPVSTPVRDAATDGAPMAAPAAPVASLGGTVRGATGEPLAFARVTVLGDSVSGWTDETGAYRLEGPARSAWQVRATHPGHEPVQQSVRLPEAGHAALDFALQPLPGPARDPLEDFRPFNISYTLPALLNTTAVTAAIELRYPPDLVDQRVGGEALLRLWLDENGRVARSALSASSGQPRLDSIALTVSREMRFRPARNGDDPVRVIVHIPVVFAPDSADGALTRRAPVSRSR